MANRRWRGNAATKLDHESPAPPINKVGSDGPKKFKEESSPPYSGAPGPRGRGYGGGKMFSQVKAAVKKDY